MYKIIDIFDNNKIFQSFALFGLFCNTANKHHLRSSLVGSWERLEEIGRGAAPLRGRLIKDLKLSLGRTPPLGREQ